VDIAFSAVPPFEEDHGLAIFGHFTQKLSGFSILGDGSQRNFQEFVGSAFAGFFLAPSILTGFGLDMLSIFEVQEGPHLGIAPEDYIAPLASVSSIGTSFGNKHFSPPGDNTLASLSAF